MNIQTKTFGEQIRDLRESEGYTLKTVSEKIGVDISLLAKVERNERQPTKQMIKNVSDLFRIEEKILLTNYLSDQIAYKILEEGADLNILRAAEKKVKYLKRISDGK
jgi:transcriptional regulator with XRE-family HTH domain